MSKKLVSAAACCALLNEPVIQDTRVSSSSSLRWQEASSRVTWTKKRFAVTTKA
jgi:hypothetical protein